MVHWLALAGSTLGIVGTGALSFDLLRSKTSEESVADFKLLQDKVHYASQELTVRMNEGLGSVANFISGYLSLLELQAQIQAENASNPGATHPDPEMEKIRQFIAGNSEVSLRHHSVAKFVEAQQSLASPEVVKRALNLVDEARSQIEKLYARQVALSQKLRRVAMAGVALVGVGAVAQLLDLLLFQ